MIDLIDSSQTNYCGGMAFPLPPNLSEIFEHGRMINTPGDNNSSLSAATPDDLHLSLSANLSYYGINSYDAYFDARLLSEAFLSSGRIDHSIQLMAYHPDYLESFLRTHNFLLRGDGPLPFDYRHYIAIMAASRYQCTYLMELQKREFLYQGGDPQWLRGLDAAPVKLTSLYYINKMMAHRPWVLKKEDFINLTKKAGWSLSEVVHAVVLLAHFHSLSSFIHGCGITPEIDFDKGHTYLDPGSFNTYNPIIQPGNTSATNSATSGGGGVGGGYGAGIPPSGSGLTMMSPEVSTSVLVSLLAGASGVPDHHPHYHPSSNILVGQSAEEMSSSTNIHGHGHGHGIGSSSASLPIGSPSSALPPHHVESIFKNDKTATETKLKSTDSSNIHSNYLINNNSNATSNSNHLQQHGSSNNNNNTSNNNKSPGGFLKNATHHNLVVSNSGTGGASGVTPSPPKKSILSSISEVDTIMAAMKNLSETSPIEDPEERKKRFEHVAASDDSHEKENLMTSATGLHTVPVLPEVSPFINDPAFTYEDFAKRGQVTDLHTFRIQDYSWQEHGFSLVNRLYADIGNFLDEKFKVAQNMTYYTMGGRAHVDTTKFRTAVWNYIQCLYGIRHDDYDYGEVNQLLERPLKSYIKTVCCYPERVTRADYDNVMREFKHSEKVHVNLMIMEAKIQAELLYALRTIMRYIL